MSLRWPQLAISSAETLPVAHLAGWLWTAYLFPVLIVLVPVVKAQIGQRQEKRTAATKAGERER